MRAYSNETYISRTDVSDR